MDIFRSFRKPAFWIPTIFVIVFLALVVLALKTGTHKYSSLTRALTQWDGQNYLSIARDGYEAYRCLHNQSLMCGNIGWFPAYPLIGVLVSLSGMSINLSMIVISWLSLWLALLILFRAVETEHSRKTAVFTLIALLVFPCSFYFATVFPYSLFLLLAVLVYDLMKKEKYTPLFILSGLLAVTYPSGSLIVIPIAYRLIRRWATLSGANRLKLAAAIVAPGLAMLIYFWYYYLAFDDFFLYLAYQRQSIYAHGLTFPLITVYNALTIIPSEHPEFLTVAFVIVVVALGYRNKVDVGWQLFMFGILLFTLTFGTTQCYYRHIIVALPLFVMLGLITEHRWRKYLFAVYLLAAVVLNLAVYLPAFKMGELM